LQINAMKSCRHFANCYFRNAMKSCTHFAACILHFATCKLMRWKVADILLLVFAICEMQKEKWKIADTLLFAWKLAWKLADTLLFAMKTCRHFAIWDANCYLQNEKFAKYDENLQAFCYLQINAMKSCRHFANCYFRNAMKSCTHIAACILHFATCKLMRWKFAN
jgi:3-hydroxy-3-methylglutaryl CoA synthase